MSDRGRRFLYALLLGLAVIAIDQATKQWAIHAVAAGHPEQLIFGIDIANVRNDGVAFGLFGGSDIAILSMTAFALGALCVYFFLHPDRTGLWVAVGLLGGGAIANLADRLRIGSVIDFIDFHAWPTFNLADVAIVIGAVILAMVFVSGPEEQPDEATD